ncbi:hypothetical protein BG011_002143 [Mortierella polycephala]|uniref:Uncharacterized protein n=1 Tax=Mortierella polycephala TaxID=41804 RepID=A0A9P6U5F2_9FUNG|nr:hypothetical protein BG011_002143 [Mortierella polycephala]
MNFFKSKKKQEDHPAPPSASAPASSSSQSAPQRGLQRGASVNNISIPPPTNTSPHPGPTATSPGPGQQSPHPPAPQSSSAPSQLDTNQENNSPELLQQQQQFQYQQQQQQYQQPQQDQGSHSPSLLAQQQMLQQQQHLQSAQMPSSYYNQDGSGFDNSNGNGALTSGPLQLPGQGNSNGSVNGSPNGGDGDHCGNLDVSSIPSNGSGDLLSTDVRKLQDEVLSWKKSQETSQTKVNQLRTTLTQKSQENRELHASLTQVTQDRLRLQELVHKRDKEMDDLRSKYLNDVRQIRATDDDHSTIEHRVRMLQAAILQLTKSSSGDRAVNLNQEAAQHLVKKRYKFGNTQPYILNMFLEKYIMDTLLEEVFHCPFYVGFSLAKEYDDIHKWMTENDFADQAVRFRQQLCFMSAKAPVAKEHATQEAARIAKTFEAKLEQLYNNWTGHQKVLDLVTKAIELSLTMRSQKSEIMAQSMDGGKVKVCVMPCFVDTNGVVVGKAKVFCG